MTELQVSQSVKSISEDLAAYIRQVMLGAETPAGNTAAGQMFCKASCLFRLLCKLSKTEDKRIAQKLLDIYKKQSFDLTLSTFDSCWSFIKFWDQCIAEVSQSLTAQFRKTVQLVEASHSNWFANRKR